MFSTDLIPALILGTACSAAVMRMTRTMMLEVLRQDYIRTAWSKGVRERVVVVRHALKNALIPVVTLVGLQLPILVGGAVIKENDYFQAAQAIGTPVWKTLLRHVLPNITAPMLIVFSVSIGGNILAAASLGFLGYGLPPATPDWGSMLSREGLQYMESAPWLALWPGLCLTIVVYCLNIFGDALRDLLDPRLRVGGR